VERLGEYRYPNADEIDPNVESIFSSATLVLNQITEASTGLRNFRLSPASAFFRCERLPDREIDIERFTCVFRRRPCF
jgi:hypothetical protein